MLFLSNSKIGVTKYGEDEARHLYKVQIIEAIDYHEALVKLDLYWEKKTEPYSEYYEVLAYDIEPIIQ